MFVFQLLFTNFFFHLSLFFLLPSFILRNSPFSTLLHPLCRIPSNIITLKQSNFLNFILSLHLPTEPTLSHPFRISQLPLPHIPHIPHLYCLQHQCICTLRITLNLLFQLFPLILHPSFTLFLFFRLLYYLYLRMLLRNLLLND